MGGCCEKETESMKSDPGLVYRIAGNEELKESNLEPQE